MNGSFLLCKNDLLNYLLIPFSGCKHTVFFTVYEQIKNLVGIIIPTAIMQMKDIRNGKVHMNEITNIPMNLLRMM